MPEGKQPNATGLILCFHTKTLKFLQCVSNVSALPNLVVFHLESAQEQKLPLHFRGHGYLRPYAPFLTIHSYHPPIHILPSI
jgi:hypothetical protein